LGDRIGLDGKLKSLKAMHTTRGHLDGRSMSRSRLVGVEEGGPLEWERGLYLLSLCKILVNPPYRNRDVIGEAEVEALKSTALGGDGLPHLRRVFLRRIYMADGHATRKE
jgi:hypothetical protein